MHKPHEAPGAEGGAGMKTGGGSSEEMLSQSDLPAPRHSHVMASTSRGSSVAFGGAGDDSSKGSFGDVWLLRTWTSECEAVPTSVDASLHHQGVAVGEQSVPKWLAR
jgi:hypothetical protein